MKIATSQEGPTAVVRLDGRLDGEGALQVAETLDRLLREGRRSVVLDLSAVTYLSSPRTMALHRAHQEYASARGELHVISPSREAADALALATRDNWRIPVALATRGTYEVSTRDPTAELTCRVHGRESAAEMVRRLYI